MVNTNVAAKVRNICTIETNYATYYNKLNSFEGYTTTIIPVHAVIPVSALHSRQRKMTDLQ